MLTALLLDLDGTLVDTNRFHAEGYSRAFAELGYAVGRDRIDAEIGKGGDKLVPDVLGAEADERHGGEIRERATAHFERLAREHRFALFPSVLDLLRTLRERGLKLAIATSAKEDDLETIFASAGTDLRDFVDAVTTASDVEASKPDSDVIHAALDKLGVSPAEAALVGDTIYDFEACTKAGVVGIGVTTWMWDADALRQSGARVIYADVADLLDHLDEALGAASPGPEVLTAQRLAGLMREALAEAERALAEGNLPIGAVVARPDGTVVGRGRSQSVATGRRLAHAELLALEAADAAGETRDLVLATTLEPCAMCLGAAVEARIETVAFGLAAPSNGADGHFRPIPERRMPRVLGGVEAEPSRALLARWLDAHGAGAPAHYARFVRKLLEG